MGGTQGLRLLVRGPAPSSSSRSPADEPSIPELVVGSDRVDLRQALTQLASRTGARVVRVDSGGQLTRVLLDLHLVNEVSLLVHPL